MTSSVDAKLRDLIARGAPFEFQSCDCLFSVVHTKGANDYRLVFFHGVLGRSTARGLVEKKSVDLSAGKSAKLFRWVWSLDDILSLVHSAGNGALVLPGALSGQDRIAHSLSLDENKPLTYVSGDEVKVARLDFIPITSSGITVFEIFDRDKTIQEAINSDDVIKIDKMLQEDTTFSLAINRGRIGNVVLAAGLDPFEMRWRGNRTGEGLLVKLIPRHPAVRLNAYTMTVVSKFNGEVLASRHLDLSKNGFELQAFSTSGKINIEIWDRANLVLASHQTGHLIEKFALNIGIISEQRRIAEFDSSGRVVGYKNIGVATGELSGPDDLDRGWRDLLRRESVMVEKIALLREKKLLTYHGGGADKQKALQDVVDLINSSPLHARTLKIWDPFWSSGYLDFLYYTSKQIDVRLITEVRTPRRLRRRKLIDNICRVFSRLHIGLGLSKTAKERKKLERYLCELRGNRIAIDCRWQGDAKGFPFHDRFLMIGGKCWSLGSSLNHIGEKHTIIFEVPYSEVIESEFDALWVALKGNVL